MEDDRQFWQQCGSENVAAYAERSALPSGLGVVYSAWYTDDPLSNMHTDIPASPGLSQTPRPFPMTMDYANVVPSHDLRQPAVQPGFGSRSPAVPFTTTTGKSSGEVGNMAPTHLASQPTENARMEKFLHHNIIKPELENYPERGDGTSSAFGTGQAKIPEADLGFQTTVSRLISQESSLHNIHAPIYGWVSALDHLNQTSSIMPGVRTALSEAINADSQQRGSLRSIPAGSHCLEKLEPTSEVGTTSHVDGVGSLLPARSCPLSSQYDPRRFHSFTFPLVLKGREERNQLFDNLREMPVFKSEGKLSLYLCPHITFCTFQSEYPHDHCKEFQIHPGGPGREQEDYNTIRRDLEDCLITSLDIVFVAGSRTSGPPNVDDVRLILLQLTAASEELIPTLNLDPSPHYPSTRAPTLIRVYNCPSPHPAHVTDVLTKLISSAHTSPISGLLFIWSRDCLPGDFSELHYNCLVDYAKRKGYYPAWAM